MALFNQCRIMNESDKLTQDQWIMIGNEYRPDQKIPEATVKRFINNEQVKPFVDSALVQVLTDLKIDIPYAIKKRKQILNKAIKENQLSAANASLDRLDSHLGLNATIKITEKHQINSNLQDNYSKAVKTVTIETEQKTKDE